MSIESQRIASALRERQRRRALAAYQELESVSVAAREIGWSETFTRTLLREAGVKFQQATKSKRQPMVGNGA